MREADYEARREQREREREAGLTFTSTLREKLEAGRTINLEEVFGRSSRKDRGYEVPDDAA
jgi:hypothetical protein